jgi:hypothetical protein
MTSGESDFWSVLGAGLWGLTEGASFGLGTMLLRKLGIEPEIDTKAEKIASGIGHFGSLFARIPGTQVVGLPQAFFKLKAGARIASQLQKPVIRAATKGAGARGTAKAAKSVAKTAEVETVAPDLLKFVGDRIGHVFRETTSLPVFKFQAGKGAKGLFKSAGGKLDRKFYERATDEIVDNALHGTRAEVAGIFKNQLGKELSEKALDRVMGEIRTQVMKGSVQSIEQLFTNRLGKLAARSLTRAVGTGIEFAAFNTVSGGITGLTQLDRDDPNSWKMLLESIESGAVHGFQTGTAVGAVGSLIPNLFWGAKPGAFQDVLHSHGLNRLPKPLQGESTRGVQAVLEFIGKEHLGFSRNSVSWLMKGNIGEKISKIAPYRQTLRRLEAHARKAEGGKLDPVATERLDEFGQIYSRFLRSSGEGKSADFIDDLISAGDSAKLARGIQSQFRQAISQQRQGAWKDWVHDFIGGAPRTLAVSVASDPKLWAAMTTGQLSKHMADHNLTIADVGSSLAMGYMMARHAPTRDARFEKLKDVGELKAESYREARAMIAGVQLPRHAQQVYQNFRLDLLGGRHKFAIPTLLEDPGVQSKLSTLQARVKSILENKSEAPGELDLDFNRALPDYIEKLGFDRNTELTRGQRILLEKVFKELTPWKEVGLGRNQLNTENFDRHYFGEAIAKLSESYWKHEKALRRTLTTEGEETGVLEEDLATAELRGRAPVYLTPDPTLKLSPEQRRLIDEANLMAQDMAIGERSVRKKLESLEQVDEVLGPLIEAEKAIQAKLGPEFNAGVLPAIRDMAFMAPYDLAFEGMRNPTAAAKSEIPFQNELAAWTNEITEGVWKTPGVAYRFTGDPPEGVDRVEWNMLNTANSMAANARSSTGDLVLRERTPTAEDAKALRAAYAKMSDYTKAVINQGQMQFNRLALSGRMGGVIDETTEALDLRMRELGLVALDGATAFDLRPLAAEIDARRGKPWLQKIVAELYKEHGGKQGHWHKGDEAFREPLAVERKQALNALDYLYVYARDRLSEDTAHALNQKVISEGRVPEHIEQITAVLTQRNPYTRALAMQLLENKGIISTDVDAFKRSVTINEGVTPEQIIEVIKRVEASIDRVPNEIKREFAETHDSWNEAERHAERDLDYEIKTHYQYAHSLGLPGRKGAALTELVEIDLMKVKESKVLDAEDVKDAFVRQIAQGNRDFGFLEDPVWLGEARDWMADPSKGRPQLSGRILRGKFDGGVVEDRMFHAIADRLQKSRPSLDITIDFKSGRVFERPTLMNEGLNDFLGSVDRATGGTAQVVTLTQPFTGLNAQGFKEWAHLRDLVEQHDAFGKDRMPVFYLAGDAKEVLAVLLPKNQARTDFIKMMKEVLGDRYEVFEGKAEGTPSRWAEELATLQRIEGELTPREAESARSIPQKGTAPADQGGESLYSLIARGRRTSFTGDFKDKVPKVGDIIRFHPDQPAGGETYVRVTKVRNITAALAKDPAFSAEWGFIENLPGRQLPGRVGQTQIQFERVRATGEEIFPSDIETMSELFSIANFAAGLPESSFKELLDPETSTKTLTKLANRSKQMRGRDYLRHTVEPGTHAHKAWVEAGNNPDGKLKVLLLDNKFEGIDVPDYDGAGYLRQRVFRGIAAGKGMSDGNTMKAQFYDAENKFLDKPQFESGQKIDAILNDVATRLGIDPNTLDGVLFRASTKIEPDGWKENWIKMNVDRPKIEHLIVDGGITAEMASKLVDMNVKNLGVKAIDSCSCGRVPVLRYWPNTSGRMGLCRLSVAVILILGGRLTSCVTRLAGRTWKRVRSRI